MSIKVLSICKSGHISSKWFIPLHFNSKNGPKFITSKVKNFNR